MFGEFVRSGLSITTRPDALDPESQQNSGHRSTEIRKGVNRELSARQEGDYMV